VAEVRRFFVALLWGAARTFIEQVLHWSNWRRKHQALAMFFHYKARNALPYLQL
jgi:transposase InsO family protein